jgi:transcriptional regulator of arginine metabolism
MNANSANARKTAVAKLISTGKIASQSELVKALKKQGIMVSQGTASRDLEDIGAIRVRNSDGEMVYALTDSQPISTKNAFPSELVLSATPSGKLASAIGTVAGDDTVIVVADTANGGSSLAKKILGLANSKSGGK